MGYLKRIKLMYILIPLSLMVILFSCEKQAEEPPKIAQEVVSMKIPPIPKEPQPPQNNTVVTSVETTVSLEKIEDKIQIDSNSIEADKVTPTANEEETSKPEPATTAAVNSESPAPTQTTTKEPVAVVTEPATIATAPPNVKEEEKKEEQSPSQEPPTAASSPKEDGVTKPKEASKETEETPQSLEKKQEVEELLALDDVLKETTEENLFYIVKGKIDPFDPLLKEKAPAVQETQEVAKEDVPQRVLTPLEKLDFGQIKLVAILSRESGSVAMVQEATGKGYIINIGTYIGRNSGQVVSIEKDKVVVQEKVKDYKGNIGDSLRELKLNKLDDKG
ncbi:MAG: pilus assembly protein PilP [Desulfamplus sp.]|nr:pilus assembly protein PilP [Desulfamplus sp.]